MFEKFFEEHASGVKSPQVANQGMQFKSGALFFGNLTKLINKMWMHIVNEAVI